MEAQKLIPPLLASVLKKVWYSIERKSLQKKYSKTAAHIKNSNAYAHLHSASLSVAAVLVDENEEEYLNVVLPELDKNNIFAGIKTAIEFSVKIGNGLKRPLRIITLKKSNFKDNEELIRYLEKEFDRTREKPTILIHASNLSITKVSQNDEWIATHWTTAHAIDVAVRLGVLSSNRVTYLIQDYEPGFHPWSTDFALAKSTYHANFRLIVNSSPLQIYLEKNEGLIVDSHRVFAPSIDMLRLRKAAEQRVRSENPVIFFYARPSKPRNLYAIGAAALHLVAAELEKNGFKAHFISAGEKHPDIKFSSEHVLVSKGKLSWDAYFEILGKSDVVLSLQHSPHPSHPPLDAVTCGCYAVVNELGDTRGGLHPCLLVAEPNAEALASQILKAVSLSRNNKIRGFDPDFHLKFGRSISEVANTLTMEILEISSKGYDRRSS